MAISTQGRDLEMTSVDVAFAQNEGQHVSSQFDPHQVPPPTARSVSFGRGRSIVSQQPCEDEIVLLEDVDIDVAIPPKLTCLDFPKAEEGREEDVAKVIRKSFSKLGLRSATQDALTALAESGLTLAHVSWQSQIEKAVEHQDDQFWEKVRSCTCIQDSTQNLFCVVLILVRFKLKVDTGKAWFYEAIILVI